MRAALSLVTLLSAACTHDWTIPSAADAAPPACGDAQAVMSAARLRRGLNVPGWLDDLPDEPRRLTLQRDDLVRIAQAGFTHVRLPFAATEQLGPASPGSPASAQLDSAVDAALSAGLGVVLSAVLDDGALAALTTDRAARQAFVAGWTALGQRLGGRDPQALAFELAHAPPTTALWNGVLAEVLPELRAALPGRLLLAPVETPASSSAPAPRPPANVIFSVSLDDTGSGLDGVEARVRAIYAWTLDRCVTAHVRLMASGGLDSPVRARRLRDRRFLAEKYRLGWTAGDRDGPLALDPAAMEALTAGPAGKP